jgi:hypothetical protein
MGFTYGAASAAGNSLPLARQHGNHLPQIPEERFTSRHSSHLTIASEDINFDSFTVLVARSVPGEFRR